MQPKPFIKGKPKLVVDPKKPLIKGKPKLVVDPKPSIDDDIVRMMPITSKQLNQIKKRYGI
jgi:hypothetical protein